ncbi:unnamed protein product [Jaminaea pallidilutea]
MASNADSGAAAKAANVVQGVLSNDNASGDRDKSTQQARGEQNADKEPEGTSGFVGTGAAKDTVEKAKQQNNN